jgi:hypothetical protein
VEKDDAAGGSFIGEINCVCDGVGFWESRGEAIDKRVSCFSRIDGIY